MRTIYCTLIALLLTLGSHICSGDVPEYREECVVWKNVTRKLNTEANVEMTCTPNVQCTGYDCTGKYSYNGFYALGSDFALDYCYGMAIHPCDTPVDMHFYVEFPDQNSTFQTTVVDPGQEMSYAIPGGSFHIGQIAHSQAFVVVDMNRTKIGGRPYMELGLKVKVRIQGAAGYFETWPQDLQRTLMPDMLIPIPACESNVITPTHTPYTCVDYVLSSTVPPPSTSLPPGVSTTTTKPVTGSANETDVPPTGAPLRPVTCQLGQMYGCSVNEMCVPQVNQDGSINTQTKTGVCTCLPNFHLNQSHGNCESADPTDIPILIIDSMPVKKNNNVIIIACSVVGVVVILAVLVGFVVYKYHKHKAIYGDRVLIMTSDDDDPLDINS